VPQAQPVLSANVPADGEHRRASAERLDGELEREPFLEAAGFQKIDLGIDERQAEAMLEMEFAERRRETGIEPILDEIVGHLEKAREVNDARRIAVGEPNAAGQAETLGQGWRLAYAGCIRRMKALRSRATSRSRGWGCARSRRGRTRGTAPPRAPPPRTGRSPRRRC